MYRAYIAPATVDAKRAILSSFKAINTAAIIKATATNRLARPLKGLNTSRYIPSTSSRGMV